MKKQITYIVFLISIAFPSPYLLAASDSVLPKSKVLLEQRAQELKEQARQRSTYRNELLKLEEELKNSQKCLEQKSSIDTMSLKVSVTSLNVAWKAVVEAPPRTPLDQGHKAFDALSEAFKKVEEAIPTISKCFDTFLPKRTLFSRLDGTQSASTPSAALVAKLGGDSLRGIKTEIAPELSIFIVEYSNSGYSRSRLNEVTTQKINQQISSLFQINEIYKQNILQAKNALSQMLTGLQTENKTIDNQINEVEKQLGELDDRLSSGSASLDFQLIIAVYMMIFALLALFLGVRFLPQQTADKVIESRSLVEVVSMAFLLLTIIILGTGEKMPKEAIGTLLGSIAGYIFGRKMSDSGK